LNPEPTDYESGALTNWAMGPIVNWEQVISLLTKLPKSQLK